MTIEIGVVSEADRQAALMALIEHAADPDEPGAWIADTARDLATPAHSRHAAPTPIARPHDRRRDRGRPAETAAGRLDSVPCRELRN